MTLQFHQIEAGRSILAGGWTGDILGPSGVLHMTPTGASGPAGASIGLLGAFGVAPSNTPNTKGWVTVEGTSGASGAVNPLTHSLNASDRVVVGGTPGTTGTLHYVKVVCGGMIGEFSNCSGWPICAGATLIGSDKSALAMCSDLLQSRRGLLRPHEVAALERQLTTLLSDQDEISESGLTVSCASLDGLIVFLAIHQPHAHPRLSVTRNGLFAGSWSPHGRAKLTLTFTQDAAEWVGADLAMVPPVRGSGAIVLQSLAGMPKRFRDWIVA